MAADRAALETEKAKLKAQALLSKSGYALGDDTDEAIAGLFAAVPDAAEDNIAALKKPYAKGYGDGGGIAAFPAAP